MDLRLGLLAVGADRRSGEGPADRRVLGRLGGVMFILAACMVAATAPLVLTGSVAPIETLAAVAMVVGLLAQVMPWQRWPRPALMALAVAALALISIASRLEPEVVDHYHPVLILLFLFVGVSQGVRRTIAFTPVVAVVWSLAVWGIADATAWVNFGVALSVAAAVGVMLAVYVQGQAMANARLEDLLGSTRSLARARAVTEAVVLLESYASDFCQSDVVFTFLADELGGTRYSTVLPTPAGLPVELTMDIETGPTATAEAMARGCHLFISDVMHDTRVSSRLAAVCGCRSAVWVPLFGEHARLGVLVIGWRETQRRVDPATLYALEILSTEAGILIERQRASERVEHEAVTDPLTGLLNRRAIERRMQRLDPGDALILIDLDRFKSINDQHGHAAGDLLLRALATCMLDSCREEDWCSRLGGDEFLLVLRAGGDGGTRGVLADLHQAWRVSEPLTTFSAGAAIHRAGEDFSHTLARADLSLYEAKGKGRNRSEVSISST